MGSSTRTGRGWGSRWVGVWVGLGWVGGWVGWLGCAVVLCTNRGCYKAAAVRAVWPHNPTPHHARAQRPATRPPPQPPQQDGETASKALGIESDYPPNAPGAVRQKRKYTRKKGGDGAGARLDRSWECCVLVGSLLHGRRFASLL